jgi:hypothetical protein
MVRSPSTAAAATSPPSPPSQPEINVRPRPHSAVALAADAAIRGQVKRLLQTLLPPANTIERRQDRRYPFPRLIRLTPVAADGCTPVGKPIVVVGNSISERGIGFFHPTPIAHRHMTASFASTEGEEIELLVDLAWCRFIGQGWYESGGRFVQLLGMAG